ncbi:MAG: hypothetical protein Athens071426_439 [Parcubacteria group bacterium Athens0714_26]|nr:MAG: hypothetical protein Athens071426_439 [Parcubacteria group bacterium Athens0714_26]
MKILSLSSDRNIFLKGSSAQNRMMEYGALFDELHIIVAVKNADFKDIKFGNVFVYPVHTFVKPFYFIGVVLIAKKILKNRNSALDFVITAQDPFETGLAAYILKLIYGFSLQLQVHTDFLSPYFARESFLNKIRILTAKFLLPRTDRIRVVSERIKRSFTAVGLKLKNEPEVLPIYIDVKKIQSLEIKTDVKKKYPNFDFIILMASRLTKEKNIGLAIEVMAEIVKKII